MPAGTNANSLIVYDVESSRVVADVVAHREDINSVAFVDAPDCNLIASASDDRLVKVGKHPEGSL